MTDLFPDDELYRRLHRDAVMPDGSVNSGAFKTAGAYDQSISVHIAKLLHRPEDALATRPHFGLGVLRVGDVERLGFRVRADPQPHDPSHALIEGENNRLTAKQLARITRVVIKPTVVP